MKIKREHVRGWLGLGLISLMLLPFSNCGKYADPASEELYSQSLEDCDDDCIQSTPENLQLKANVGSGNDYGVPEGLTDWNIAGECNEGGYPSNVIKWQLYLNGIMVRHSGMLGMSGSAPVHTRCINGRFSIYLNMSAIAEDPVNRTGLRTNASGARAAHDLYIEIFGERIPNDPQPARNGVKGRIHLSLSAI